MRNLADSLAWKSIVLVVLLSTTLISCARNDNIQAPATSANSSLALAMRRPLTLGVVVDKEMRVVTLDRQGAAEHAGVQIGDKLVSINGVAFTLGREAIQATFPDTDSSPASDAVMLDEEGGAVQSEPQPVPAQIVGQADIPVEEAPATPSVSVGWQAAIVVERLGQITDLVIDFSVQPYYDDLPTPTPLAPDIGLLYF